MREKNTGRGIPENSGHLVLAPLSRRNWSRDALWRRQAHSSGVRCSQYSYGLSHSHSRTVRTSSFRSQPLESRRRSAALAL